MCGLSWDWMTFWTAFGALGVVTISTFQAFWLRQTVTRMRGEGRSRDEFDKNRLRGNEAAHQIKAHDKRVLDAAMSVVDHLLTSVYLLDGLTQDPIDLGIR